MILITDFLPYLQQLVLTSNSKKNKVNLITGLEFKLDSSGTKMASILNKWNIENLYLMFAGGWLTEYIKSELKDNNINYNLVSIKDSTPMKICLSGENTTIFAEKLPKITQEEFEDFYANFTSLLNFTNYVLLPNREATNLDDRMVSNILSLAQSHQKPVYSVGDSYSTKEIVDLGFKGLFLSKEYLSKLEDQGAIDNSVDVYTALRVFDLDELDFAAIPLSSHHFVFWQEGRKVQVKSSYHSQAGISGEGLLLGYLIGKERNYDDDLILKLATALSLVYNEKSNKSGRIKEVMNHIEIL